MIKIPIKGGLGNQMFGYAFYKYVLSKGIDAKLSWREFVISVHHYGIELPYVFPNIQINLPYWTTIALRLNPYIVNREWIRKMFRLLFKICDLPFTRYKQRNPNSFDVLDLSKDSVFIGYWQNSKYVEPVREIILKDFEMNTSLLSKSDILRNINSSESIALHVRRGDYLNPIFEEWHVIKTSFYYFKAISIIKEQVHNPHFFIFSDDMEWCKSIFKGSEYTFVQGHTGRDSYLDMYLMSRCKHNIISNSTFSWWGAYLNNNKNKVVIAPKKWTNSGILSSDFCPNTWCFISTTDSSNS